MPVIDVYLFKLLHFSFALEREPKKKVKRHD